MTGTMTSAGVRPAAAVELRPMRWWDVERVLPLEHTLFGDESWSAELFWSELAQHDTRFYVVAETDGKLVAYAGLCAYPDEAFVQTIGVDPSCQRAGLGARLLTVLLDEAARRGKHVVSLEVRADNEVAQRLYARFGFEAVGLRRGYYQPSNVDAVVMIRTSEGAGVQ